MAARTLVGVFAREEDILNVTNAARREGLTILDVYTPYAVHGLDRAMALEPSKLPWVCFALGVTGAALKVWFEYLTTAIWWPINVGGKPWNSLPAFVPVTFEVMVLFAGVSTVVAFFLVAKLRPWRKALIIHPRVTDDRFVLLVEQKDATFDLASVRRLFERYNAVEIEERDLEEIP